MKRIVAMAAAAAAFAAPVIADQLDTRQQKGEAQLARMLAGYQASGEAQNCISGVRANRIRVIAYVGVVYDDGDTIYVARAAEPEMLRDSSVPVFERFSSQLCTTDVMRAFDRHNPNFTEPVFLEDFVPYTRVKGDKTD